MSLIENTGDLILGNCCGNPCGQPGIVRHGLTKTGYTKGINLLQSLENLPVRYGFVLTSSTVHFPTNIELWQTVQNLICVQLDTVLCPDRRGMANCENFHCGLSGAPDAYYTPYGGHNLNRYLFQQVFRRGYCQ
jgi:hypothetical protein